jgi:hypothetical protein
VSASLNNHAERHIAAFVPRRTAGCLATMEALGRLFLCATTAILRIRHRLQMSISHCFVDSLFAFASLAAVVVVVVVV